MENISFALKRLHDPLIVASFQRLCGVECLSTVSNSDGVYDSDGQTDEAERNVNYTKYVKDRETDNYIKQDSYNKLLNGKTVRQRPQLDKEGVPPFTSDDSDDPDIGVSRGEGHYKITPHRIKYQFVYYMFRIFSFFGDEAFYLTFLPFCVWNLDSYVTRHTVYVWVSSMYIGQVLKDILKWPRPLTPPVVRLETDYAQEFSMPSTHAVAGSSIPFMLAYSIIHRYEISTPLVLTIACIWCVMVCCSRLYLGVHTVLDLLAGLVLTAGVAVCIVPFIRQLDWFLLTNPVAPPLLLFLGFMLSTFCYPAPNKGNTTHKDCVQIIAAFIGFLLGSWCNYYVGMSVAVSRPEGELYKIADPTLKFFASAVIRFMIGGITLLLVKIVVKIVSIKGMSYVLGLEKPDRHNPTVKIGYTLITYTTLGIIIMWTVPILHAKFGLARPGYYAEVL